MTEARSGRQLICLISTHGKTEDEIVEEWTRAMDAWKAREAERAADEAAQRHTSPDGGTTTE